MHLENDVISVGFLDIRTASEWNDNVAQSIINTFADLGGYNFFHAKHDWTSEDIYGSFDYFLSLGLDYIIINPAKPAEFEDFLLSSGDLLDIPLFLLTIDPFYSDLNHELFFLMNDLKEKEYNLLNG